jgi:hypothetical protein
MSNADDDWRSKPESAADLPVATKNYRTSVRSLWMNPNRPVTLSLIAYGSIGIGWVTAILQLTTLFPFLFPEATRQLNPSYQFVQEMLTPVEYLGAIVRPLLGALCSMILFCAGIGLLKMTKWGRNLMFVYIGLSVALTVWTTAYNLITFDRFNELHAAAVTQPINMRDLERSNLVRIVVMLPALLIWPAIILTILTRKHVKEVIEAADRS